MNICDESAVHAKITRVGIKAMEVGGDLYASQVCLNRNPLSRKRWVDHIIRILPAGARKGLIRLPVKWKLVSTCPWPGPILSRPRGAGTSRSSADSVADVATLRMTHGRHV